MKKFFKNNFKIIMLAILTFALGFITLTTNVFSTTKSTKVDNTDKKGYNYSNNYDDYYYDNVSNDKYEYLEKNAEVPAVRYDRSIYINLFETFDPYLIIETDGEVTMLYNNVDNTKVGSYIMSFSICNRNTDARCRYINISVIVRDLDGKYQQYEEYTTYEDKTSPAKWDDVEIKKCNVGSSNCKLSNIDLPTATDPYTREELKVKVVSNNVNINRPGYYYITYSATTKHGITSSVVRQVQIIDNNNKYESNTYGGQIKTKEINNYEWKNVVTSEYKCVNPNASGADAWEFVAKLNNDDHATYFYNNNGYSGILTKDSFYELNPYEGSDIRDQLGSCSYYGQKKTLSRTWIGVYSGTVTKYN